MVQDSHYLEREKHQMRTYFETLATEARKFDHIVLFGPARAAEDFKNYLDDRARDLSSKIASVEKADSMTLNQVKAWARDYFG